MKKFWDRWIRLDAWGLLVVALALLPFIAALGSGQTKPPAYRLRGGQVERTLPGYSVAEVKAAILKALALMDWKVVSEDAETGGVNATKNLPPDFDPLKRPHVFVGAATELGDVQIAGLWYIGQKGHGSSPKVEARQFWDEFFGKLAEALK